ncbi:MAG: SDR family NAD(P)-dependent oxidoreductase [Myxococcales bacterium]|nr:SDR family NAD(P)-dependent oxidoreductase [Myxococcales bacterium]
MEGRSLKDGSVLITGGSRGLGRALALELARRGARLALVARHANALDDVVAEIGAIGAEAHAIVGDVGDKHDIHPIAHEAAALLGPIDVLINGASTLGPTPMPLLLDTECEDLERVMEVNLLGPFRLTKLIAGNMALRGRGVVVNVSSDAAVEAYPGWGSYGVSKAALDHLTRTFAAELGDVGVRFLSIDPGEMDTRMHRDALPDADPSTLAQPEQVAAVMASLVADASTAPGGSRHTVPALRGAP